MLSEIRVVRRGSNRRLVLLDDEQWRMVPAAVVREAGLQVGDESTTVQLAQRISMIEPRLARDRAVRLLTYRDRSSAELTCRLEEDGYLPEVSIETVRRLSDLGLIDDDRFARTLARSLTHGKGLGRSRAAREMAARGVAPELAETALGEALPADDEQRSALEQARVFARRVGATRERVAARLMRKGFGRRISLDAARHACDTRAEPDSDEEWDPTDVAADDAPF